MGYKSKFTGTEVERRLDLVPEDIMVNGTSVIVDRIAQIDLSDYANKIDLDSKQNIISDLTAIRQGAALGATAIQSHQDISGKADKASLSKVATSGSYNDLSDKPTIPNAVTESTVSGWGFTKNTGTYSKPSTGIPKIDLSNDVQNSLTKADSALQEETYKGTVTTSNIEDDPNISDVVNYYVKPSTGIPKYDLSADVAESLDKANNAPSKAELNDALLLKVDKQDGKKLTTEDFTSELKTKLESLNNYDDTSVKNAFEILRNDFNTLINGDTSSSINSFNKIINFLNGVEVSKSLNGIVATIEQQIENTNKNIPTKTSQLTNDSGYLNSATAVLNIVYPVGAVYISITPENLFDIFGFGTWELIKDTFLLGAGDVYQAGSTGGEATHKLTTSEMPSHSHNTYQIANFPNGNVDNRGGYGYTEVANSRTAYGNVVGSTGGSQPHNNMPPYLTVYIWKRIA